MALTWAIPILLSVVVNYFCSANQHKFGYGSYGKSIYIDLIEKISTQILLADHQYFYKELTHDRGNGLKNYTLIFNFLGEGIKEVTYVDIDIADVRKIMRKKIITKTDILLLHSRHIVKAR